MDSSGSRATCRPDRTVTVPPCRGPRDRRTVRRTGMHLGAAPFAEPGAATQNHGYSVPDHRRRTGFAGSGDRMSYPDPRYLGEPGEPSEEEWADLYRRHDTQML